MIVGVLAGLLALANVSLVAAAQALFNGSLGSGSAISGTLRETTPILITGAAVYLALQAGLFNIGAEGQFLVGALACAVIGLQIGGAIGVLFGIVGGAITGSLWSLPAGLIRACRGGHEVITTIMLNSVAAFIATALASGPFKDPGQQSPTTASLADSTRLPWLYQNGSLQLSSALLLAVLLVVGMAFWLKRFVSGHELRLVGANPRAASFAGVSARATIVKAMLVSGAIAGFGGAVQVLAYEGRFYSDFSPGYGFIALGVALLAGRSVLAVVPAALFFGVLNHGSASLQLLGVPKGIVFVVLAALIVVFGAVRYRTVSVRS